MARPLLPLLYIKTNGNLIMIKTGSPVLVLVLYLYPGVFKGPPFSSNLRLIKRLFEDFW
jgi:hypothetical protein